jgi:hypothetical protein
MSFEKFRHKFGSCKLKRPIIDKEDYEEFIPYKSKVQNPIEKLRHHKIKRQGYQPILNEEPQYYVPKEVVMVPKKLRQRPYVTGKRRAPSPPRTITLPVRIEGSRQHKRSHSEPDDMIDFESPNVSSASSSDEENKDPFANWQKFK